MPVQKTLLGRAQGVLRMPGPSEDTGLPRTFPTPKGSHVAVAVAPAGLSALCCHTPVTLDCGRRSFHRGVLLLLHKCFTLVHAPRRYALSIAFRETEHCSSNSRRGKAALLEFRVTLSHACDRWPASQSALVSVSAPDVRHEQRPLLTRASRRAAARGSCNAAIVVTLYWASRPWTIRRQRTRCDGARRATGEQDARGQ